MDSCFPQSTPQCYDLLLLFADASTFLLSATVPATQRSAYQLTLLAPPRLLFSGPTALCLLVPHCCSAACCPPPAHSPPPLATPPPVVTSLHYVAPLLFGWLLHFPATQPLHLLVPRRGLHHSSRLHLSSRPSSFVGCRVSQRLTPPILMRRLPPVVCDSTWLCLLLLL